MVEHLKIKNPKCSKDGFSKICIRIADVTCALVNGDPELRLGIKGTMKKFIIDNANPDVTIRTSWNKLEEGSSGNMLFDSGNLWQLYYKAGYYHFRFASPILGSIPYKVARIKKDFKSGEVIFHRPYFDPDQTIYPLEYPLDELLINNFLLLGKGIEVHTCGMKDHKGNGHLFVGHSGTGKSTMAKLWHKEPGTTILSDDRIILRKQGERLWMYGTPWHGEAGFSSPERAPLTRVYFLEKGQKNKLIPQRNTKAVERLFACSFPSFYNPKGLDFSLGFLGEVAKAVPSYELSFVPDKRVVKFIQRLDH